MTEMMEWRAMLIVWRLQELAQFALREVARSQPPAVSFCSTLQPQLELLSIPAPCYCHAHRIHSHRQPDRHVIWPHKHFGASLTPATMSAYAACALRIAAHT